MLLSMVYLGSYYGACPAGENMVDLFKANEKEKRPDLPFKTVRKIAIEAPAGTVVHINETEIVMPSSCYFELGLDWVQIYSLIFDSAVDVNIIYMY